MFSSFRRRLPDGSGELSSFLRLFSDSIFKTPVQNSVKRGLYEIYVHAHNECFNNNNNNREEVRSDDDV